MFTIKPITFKNLCDYITLYHRHVKRPQGWKFGIAIYEDNCLVGVACASRPVSRVLQESEPLTIEITRVCVDGTKNANSFAYGALCRAAKALGYKGVISYTLDIESWSSLKAAGFTIDGYTKGNRSWYTPSRNRSNAIPPNPKVRWRKIL